VPNVTYMSGFTGDDSLALVARDRHYLITDFRYIEQAEADCPGWQIVRREKSLWASVAQAATDASVRRMGFESAHLSVARLNHLQEAVGAMALLPIEGAVEKLREVKDAAEVKRIEEALRCQEQALREVMGSIKPGMGERDVALELDYHMRRLGAQSSAFETIVAAGERGSLPHARPTERVIAQGDALLIDWGARRFFYNSDLTRTLHLDTVTPEFEKVYTIVREAQERALAVIRPGVAFAQVDAAARDYIRQRGYGEWFGHSLGHGVGLEVHESPVVREGNEELLRPGTVFTVEPGIYMPGWGGIRIEDMVLVAEQGCRVLSRFEKDLSRLTL
jgi:Xaa-Pro aminopeptidase